MRDIATRTPTRKPRAVPRAWWAVLVLSLLIAAYGAGFVARGEASFAGEFAASFRRQPWAIFSHAIFGTLALLAGPLQFRTDLRNRFRRLHRVLGRVYVVAAFGIGTTGLLMSPFSFGGMITHTGFGLLAALTIATTWLAFARIRAGDVTAHREWMLRNFALIFAGVALRVELPLLVAANGGAFEPAYQVVAWLSWVPNLVWAQWWIRRSRGPIVVRAGDRLAA
jgi:uncharacterized membrane protein